MADSVYSLAGAAIGGGSSFELTLKGDGGEQKFAVAISDIPELVQQLTAIAWASAATNRPVPGTVLPRVHAFPVKRCEVGFTQEGKDPVMMIELFGGVKFGLHFTPESAKTASSELARMLAGSPVKKHS